LSLNEEDGEPEVCITTEWCPMKWLEIPAHRVLEVESKELEEEFDMYDGDGKLCGGSSVYLLFRRKDGKRFKFAKYGDLYGAIKRNRAYLEEV
jgi:hypothetical protein